MSHGYWICSNVSVFDACFAVWPLECVICEGSCYQYEPLPVFSDDVLMVIHIWNFVASFCKHIGEHCMVSCRQELYYEIRWISAERVMLIKTRAFLSSGHSKRMVLYTAKLDSVLWTLWKLWYLSRSLLNFSCCTQFFEKICIASWKEKLYTHK
jgi:hypothetical protein